MNKDMSQATTGFSLRTLCVFMLAAVFIAPSALSLTAAEETLPEPPANVKQIKVNGKNKTLTSCNQTVNLRLGRQTLFGWVGDEMVSLFRGGLQFFGVLQDQPINLKLFGSQDRGYWLKGTLGNTPVLWKVQDEWVSGNLSSCNRPTLVEDTVP